MRDVEPLPQRVADGVVVDGRELLQRLERGDERRERVDDVRGDGERRGEPGREPPLPCGRADEEGDRPEGDREQRRRGGPGPRCAPETFIVAARLPIQRASQSTAPRTTTSPTRAPSFSSRIRRRETGLASRRSIVPFSSSPAIARAPAPIAATRKRSGIMKENSSLPRYPAPEV